MKSSGPEQTLSRFQKVSNSYTLSKRNAKQTGHDAPETPTASDRRTAVLYAVVNEYIRTGLPSGSRTLAETYGLDLSPATVRAVLKELEEEELLTQPHTSAGRLPTDRALRLYVDAVLSDSRSRKIPVEHAERIRRFLSEQGASSFGHRGSGFAQEIGELLSELTGNPAIILENPSETRVVTKVRFIATRPGELLAVVVLADGSVENRFIFVDPPPSASDLDRVHNLLDELSGGCTLRELRAELGRLVLNEQNSTGGLGQLGAALVHSTLVEVGNSQELVITGRTNLLGEHGDPTRTRQMLIVLEDRERLIHLLDRVIGSSRVQVFLGKESETGPGESVSLVAAGFQQTRGARGAMGILGPPGMDYPGLIPLLSTVAQAIGGPEDDEKDP
jgi:heat-inducible transcriptional repressor